MRTLRWFAIMCAAMLAVVTSGAFARADQNLRQALFIGSADSDASFELLHDALTRRNGFRLQRTGSDGELRNQLRGWANAVRQDSPASVLVYVQADLVKVEGQWQLRGNFLSAEQSTAFPLSQALKGVAQASQTSLGVLLIECGKNEARAEDLRALLEASNPKGPLAAIVVRTGSENDTRTLARLLRTGKRSPGLAPRPLTIEGLGELLKPHFAERQLASVGPVEKTSLIVHRPPTLEELLADLGEELGGRLPAKSVVSVEVQHEGGDYPLLARVAAAHFRAALTSGFEHRVLDPSAAESHPNSTESLATMRVRLRLSEGMSASDVRVHYVADRPQQPSFPKLEGAGDALLTPTEWCLKGHSVVTKGGLQAVTLPGKGHAPPRLATIDFTRPSDVQRVVEETRDLEARSRQEPHPLSDAAFPYRLEARVGGRSVPGKLSSDKRRMDVTLAKGATYTLAFKNLSDKPVFLRLLVDGLNTLPDYPLVEKRQEGDLVYEVAAKDRQSQLVSAPIALLHNARCWYCDRGEYEVRGFFTQIDSPGRGSFASIVDGRRAAFVVTDASLSAAAERGQMKDVGIITAAVFSAVDDPVLKKSIGPRFGTMLGAAQRENVELYTGNYVPGDLLAVIHLHYGFDSRQP